MKNLFRLPAIILSLFLLTASQCKKSTPLPEFYFLCKVDGQEYIPNGCTNCRQCDFLGDTLLLLHGNRGFETLGMGIRDVSGIKTGTYILNEIHGRRADYKNGTLVNDRYFTDSSHTGKLEITSIDKPNKIMAGTFSFNAYNSYRNDSVSITEGKFRLQYLDH